MNARVARTSEGSRLCAACAENHQGSRFLSAAAPVHVVPSSPPHSLCCECQYPRGRGFAAAGPSPDSGRHRGLHFVASSEVINDTCRSPRLFLLRRVSLRGVGWGAVAGSRWLETVRLSNTRSNVKQTLLLRRVTAGGGVSQGQFPPSLLFS